MVFREPKEILASSKAMKIHVKEKYWKYLDLAKGVAFIIVAALAALSLLTILPLSTPVKPFIVLTGSMNPSIPQGSIIFVQRGFENIKVGDIITFKRPDKPVDNVTHRIVGETTLDNKVAYRTKGDANDGDDMWVVRKEAIWGKALFSVPLLGYLISFSKTKVGVLLVIALPLIIITVDELRIIYKEIIKLRRKSEVKKGEDGSGKAKSVLALIPFLLTVFIVKSNYPSTLALFTDTIQSTNQSISTDWWVVPAVTVYTPDGGELLYHGNTYNISWTASPSDPAATVSIDLYYSTDGGATYPNIITTAEANDGSYDWVIPLIFSSTAKIKAVATDSHGLVGSDVSDNNFTIKSAIVLNEFLPNPVGDDNALKPNGEWVELYNNGSVAVDVVNWVLYDAIDTHELIISGAITNTGGTVVASGGFLVVYRDGDGDFSLNNTGGDTLRLYNGLLPAGNLIDSYTYTTDAPEGKSYARIPDGVGDWVDPCPTPGEDNVSYDCPTIDPLSTSNPEVSDDDVFISTPEPVANFSDVIQPEPILTPTPTPTPTPTATPTPIFIPPEESTSSSSLADETPSSPDVQLTPSLVPVSTQLTDENKNESEEDNPVTDNKVESENENIDSKPEEQFSSDQAAAEGASE